MPFIRLIGGVERARDSAALAWHNRGSPASPTPALQRVHRQPPNVTSRRLRLCCYVSKIKVLRRFNGFNDSCSRVAGDVLNRRQKTGERRVRNEAEEREGKRVR